MPGFSLGFGLPFASAPGGAAWEPLTSSPSLYLAQPNGSNLQDSGLNYPDDHENIFKWLDSSGNSNHAQTVANFPSFRSGSPCVDANQVTATQVRMNHPLGFAAGAMSFSWKGRLRQVTTIDASGFGLLARFTSGTTLCEIYLTDARAAGYQRIHVRCGFTSGAAGNGVGCGFTLDTLEHQITIVYDGSGSTDPAAYQIFIDGVSQSVVASGSNTGVTEPSSLFAAYSGAYPLPCASTFVLAWGRALSAGEITNLHDWASDVQMANDISSFGSPSWWHEVLAGRIWQDTGAVTPAVLANDPVARIDAKVGTNFTQSTSTLRPYLTALGDGLGVRTDDIDDNIGSTSTFTAGEKTFFCVFEIFSAPSTTGSETIIRLGATPQQIIVRHSGLSASSAKGFHFAVDRTSTTGVCIQPTGGAALLSNGIHTLVIRYNGGGTLLAGSYRAWLDGVEVSLTTGGNVAASGNTRWLATSVPSEPCNSAVRLSGVYTAAVDPADCLLLSQLLETYR